MLVFASYLALALVAVPSPSRLGRLTTCVKRCAQVTLVEIFQPPGCETSDETTRPLLLFLPGIDGSGLAGASQWPRLRADFSIHALRISPEDRTSFDAQVNFVERWLVEHGVGDRRDAMLVGESAGAVLALGVALRAPDRVSALCLVNPATSFARSPMALVAPLLPLMPRQLYEAAPAFITPIFGRPSWAAPILGEAAPPRTASLPAPDQMLRASRALAALLPPDALRWRVEQLGKAAAAVNAQLDAANGSPAWAARTLLLAAELDVVLDSMGETKRLAGVLPGATRRALSGAGHACLDGGSLNLRLELQLSGLLAPLLRPPATLPPPPPPISAVSTAAASASEGAGAEVEAETSEAAAAAAAVAAAAAAVAEEEEEEAAASAVIAAAPEEEEAARLAWQSRGSARGVPDPAPASLFEGWLGQMRRLFSPTFFSTDAGGNLVPGLEQLPPTAEGASPLLLLGNHQLFGFDGPMILEELLRERGVALTALVYPPLLEAESPLAPLPYPLPGTAATFERFGAVPASGRALFKSLSRGEHTLLFPGGGREVFKRKGEAYRLFWPDSPDVVRLAARLNATLLPFAGLGGDDSFEISLDSDELLNAPLVGPFFRERVAKMPSLVQDDVFVPPVGTILPARYYFAFGAPLPTDGIDPADDAAVEAAYAELRAGVLGGIERLRELRERDPYSDFAQRTAYEVLNGGQAPSS